MGFHRLLLQIRARPPVLAAQPRDNQIPRQKGKGQTLRGAVLPTGASPPKNETPKNRCGASIPLMSIERMRKRLSADRAGFIEPCLPYSADKPPSGSN
jgi:hypothetical protein